MVLKPVRDDYTLAVNYNNLGIVISILTNMTERYLILKKHCMISTNEIKPLHALLFLNIAEVQSKQKFS
jgi:hypothetical protein